ncbi:MAG: FAD:protein FMN transferase [Candidatus Omnitrophica bacterium]|nr:FAD:protein FMN transferase [Candidatus Omnitrophota bacterium]
MIGKNIFRIFVILLLVLSAAVISYKPKDQKKDGLNKYSETKLLMDTVVRIDICATEKDSVSAAKAFQVAWKTMEDDVDMLSVFDENSDISKLNNAKTKPVEVHKKVYNLVAKARYFSDISDGAFDVTVEPLMQLWRDAKKTNKLPAPRAVRKVLNAMGEGQIELLGNNRMRLKNSLTKLDLSGIAKGFVVDEAAQVLRANGFSDFLIVAGGDMYAGGTNIEGRPWQVGVRDPRDKNKVIGIVSLSNKGVTTSGGYERFFEIQGKKYSHIMNPKTGFPAEEALSSTVIANTTEDADALSTALCVLGTQKGTELINSLGGDYASLIVTPDGQSVVQTASKEYKNFQVKE